MTPDDNGRLPADRRPFRALVIAGSARRNCPGVDSKARSPAWRVADRLPADWEIDFEDLGNIYGRARIQSCNGCVSTSMALCVWPCNCDEPRHTSQPDLMWDLDLHARLDLADVWAIIGPVYWYAPSSNLTLMFDRLVCMNGGNPREDLIDHKDPEKAVRLEHPPERPALSQNHLEGRTAAFFCYGDGRADELDASGRPKILRHRDYFDPSQEPFAHMRDTYAPLVWHCRYGGVEVPDELWRDEEFGRGEPHSRNQAEHLSGDPQALAGLDEWTDHLVTFVSRKGQVSPNQYRASGYEAPSHRAADLKLQWRELRISAGLPPAGSSPGRPQEAGLNGDATFSPERGEGEKLPED